VVALLLAGCAHAPQHLPPVEIRFQRNHTGHIVVPIDVDGQSGMPFIVDTGASATIMTPRAIAAARLRRVADDDEAIGAAGVAVPGAAYAIGRLRAGAAEVVGLRVVENSLEALADDSIAGVLGRDFLGRFRVEIDLRSALLRLHDPASPPRPRAAALSFRDLEEGLIGLDVRLNGSPVGAVLDLGAQATIVNRAAATSAGVRAGARQGVAMGVGGAAAPVSSERFSRVEIGGATLTDRALYVGDLPVFEQIGLRGPAMILGLDLLAGGVIDIDYRRRRLLLQLPGG
jgi:predicted aspartyl protease